MYWLFTLEIALYSSLFWGQEHSMKISASQIPVLVCFLYSIKQTDFWHSWNVVTAWVVNKLWEKVLQETVVWDSALFCFQLTCLFHLAVTKQLSKLFSSVSPGNPEGLAKEFILSKVRVEWNHIYGMRMPHKYPLRGIRAQEFLGHHLHQPTELEWDSDMGLEAGGVAGPKPLTPAALRTEPLLNMLYPMVIARLHLLQRCGC